MIARRVIDKIRRAETDVGHSRTVVVGDFNMNPFEFGLVAADCFHAVMDTRIADKQSRKVQGEVRKFFYNPMWHLFRETFSAPLGTYYYNNSSRQRNYYWNTFDQVLVSPDLLDSFPIDQLSVLTTIGKIALVREDGRPDPAVGSDHLPILFDLAL
jgi:endonuclease/exonuclease/phosphatase family metal-dependent hydrolase